MDDNQNQVQDDQAVQAPVAPVQNQPIQPTGGINKEHQVPIGKTSEFIKPSEAEPNIPPEVAEAGVEKVSQAPVLDDSHYKVGIKPAKEETPVLAEPTGLVDLPMTEEEVAQVIKTTGKDDSKHWLAVLVDKMFKQLKIMHGKIIGS